MSSSGEKEIVGNIEPSGTAAEEDKQPKYCVELILDKRLNNNKVEYFLKWKGYGDRENCWVPEENLDCPSLLKTFEENLIREEKERKKREKRQKMAKLECVGSGVKRIRSNSTTSCASSDAHSVSAVVEPEKKYIEQVEVHDVSNVLEKIPDRILGASDTTGHLMFLIKWKGLEESDWIWAEEAKLMCPQLVIKFYESRFTWGKI
ncbi:unnamed protein product [Macrosiphum euphorbiae]|uniref:Chromo domain-containing protein n=1 Tax=Macrosiphum euphorbiae TaxID=13131 RepID=A0AAV0XZC3_9HEMI|nr:unnamed protein product [Macrosiphum euphorbiae]